MEEKRILCFGNSNTWGCNPADGSRFGTDVRWPRVLESLLGTGFSVIEDAKCGRTVLDLNFDPELNGVSWIRTVMKSCMPLNAVIICLGTNDVFDSGEVPLWRIICGLREIISIIIESHKEKGLPSPHVVMLTPVMPSPQPEEMNFYRLQINKVAALIAEYPGIARETGSLCLDITGRISSSEKDGAHLERESHIKLGYMVADFIRQEMNEN